MTRDFNKPGRGNVRPFSRTQSSYRQGNEQTPRPARPRPNRGSIDRAWESGSPRQHADYRTRSQHEQAPRNSWRNNQQSEHSSAPNSRKPYSPGPGDDGNRHFDRSSSGNNQTRRPYGADRQSNQFGERRDHSSNRSNPGGPNRYGARPENSNAPNRPYGQHNPSGNRQPNVRPPYREHDTERDSRGFERSNRPPRNVDYNRQPSRSDERNGRPPRQFARDSHSPMQPQQHRDTQNPRWQSRPTVQRESFKREQPSHEHAPEHFEGDYERFSAPSRPEFKHRKPRKEYRRPFAPGRPFQGKQTNDLPDAAPVEEERHVTRMPDGRVLKGSQPAQRKNAEFWTDVHEETERLIDQIETPPATAEKTSSTTETADQPGTRGSSMPKHEIAATSLHDTADSSKKRKPRKGPASSAAREKRAKTKAPTPKGPKPSQHGYKWPTP